MEITRKEFSRFVRVQASGKTNMMDVRAVSALASLSMEKVLEVLDKYDKLDKKFPTVSIRAFGGTHG